MFEVEGHLGLDVGAAPRLLGGGATSPGVAEQAAQDVADSSGGTRTAGSGVAEQVAEVEVKPARRAGAATAAWHPESAAAKQRPRLVVLLAGLLRRQHVVRLGDLLELLLRLRVAGIGIGVMKSGELAVGLLDLGGGRVFRDAERLVVVLLDVVAGAHRRPSFRSARDLGGRRWVGVVTDLRLSNGHPRRPHDPTGVAIAGLEDLDGCRLGHVVGVGMHECFVLGRVERIAGYTEPGESELQDRGVECLGDLPEAPLELAVLAGPPDVVEHRKQGGQRIADGELPHRVAITFNALAVVRVFGLHTLQVSGAFDNFGAQLRKLDRVETVHVSASRIIPPQVSGARRSGRLCVLRILRHRAGRRIEMHAALVANPRLGRRLERIGPTHDLPSSTISASITSSAPSVEPATPGALPSSVPAPSWASWPASAAFAWAFA